MAGGNVPMLNQLLQPFGIQLGIRSFAGDVEMYGQTVSVLSATSIVKFPKGGYLFSFPLFNETDIFVHKNRNQRVKEIPILGVLPHANESPKSGKIIVYGDSNCIDSNYLYNDCFELFFDMLDYLETTQMNLFAYFENYELPLPYEYDEQLSENQIAELNQFILENGIIQTPFYTFPQTSIEVHNNATNLQSWMSKKIEKNELFSYKSAQQLKTILISAITIGLAILLSLLLFFAYCYIKRTYNCLLYTSDAADEEDSVDLGGRRFLKKKI
eukprot:TRINITY_DN5964_c0_g1_i1.p1 TRINITY_DN5964_c0_g1~~TRINITY_DN5964_c0_g1_i1.p1  ORF type:complete len:271 (-),score=32.68 TRINITY_DN5964_c0_g1_i1:78-890(-)